MMDSASVSLHWLAAFHCKQQSGEETAADERSLHQHKDILAAS
jgi:hypothetical protein